MVSADKSTKVGKLRMISAWRSRMRLLKIRSGMKKASPVKKIATTG